MKDLPTTGNSWTYTLHFASAKNMEQFMSSPARFLPKWGGFCAYGIVFENATSENGAWPWARDFLGPPGGAKEGWFFYDDELYFTFHGAMQVRGHDIAGIWVAFFSRCQRHRCGQVGWLENAAQNKAIGDARWASWFGTVSRNAFFASRKAAAEPPKPYE